MPPEFLPLIQKVFAVAYVAKILVDRIKAAESIPVTGRWLAASSVPIAYGLAVLLDLFQGTAITGQVLAGDVFVALLASVGAVAVTESQNRAGR